MFSSSRDQALASSGMRDPIPIYVHLRRAKDLIDRDFPEPLDVPALAQEAHSSRAHFVRSFKKAFHFRSELAR
jgi:AraC-like DNA-binding protein